MPTFTYKATRPNGESYTGEVEAKDRFEVYTLVRNEGASIVSVSEKKAHFISLEFSFDSFSRIKETDKVVLMRNLSAMIRAGLSLARALSVMERQTKKKKLKAVLAAINAEIQKGEELHVAMKLFPKVFSPLAISMVKAGEESGTLADTLATISEQMERSYQLKKKIRGALIYPSIIITALVGVGALMLIFIVPTLTQTFEELQVELPASTAFIIALSKFLTDYTLLALGLLMVAIAGFVAALKTALGKRVWDLSILYVPIIGTLVRETNAARTGRTLSSLLASGVSVITALEITRDVVQHSYFKEVLDGAGAAVEKGAPMSEVFTQNEKLYPPLVGELIAVGEETGKMPDMLMQIAIFYEGEVEQKTKNISTIIEPFLMLIVGGAVGFFAVSMITPIYSVTAGI